MILLWENGVGHIWWGQAVGVLWSQISLVLSNGSSVGHSGLMSIVHAVLVGCKVAVVERTGGLWPILHGPTHMLLEARGKVVGVMSGDGLVACFFKSFGRRLTHEKDILAAKQLLFKCFYQDLALMVAFSGLGVDATCPVVRTVRRQTLRLHRQLRAWNCRLPWGAICESLRMLFSSSRSILILVVIYLFVCEAQRIRFMTRLGKDFHVTLLRSDGQRALNGVFLHIHVARIAYASDSSCLLLHILALALLASKLLHRGASLRLPAA